LNVLLFGPPGAGKGTQSALLVEKMGMAHISTGDLFRAAIKNKTKLGLEAKSYIDRGELVPDSVTINMVGEALDELKGRAFILDGFPRNVPQAEALDSLLADKRLRVEKAIFLEVANKELIERLSGRRICRSCGAVYHIKTKPLKNGKSCDQCGGLDVYQRDDDKAEAIQKRLTIYSETTEPLKSYYKQRNQMAVLNGIGEAKNIFKEIESLIKG
jgi:adenylate kinase